MLATSLAIRKLCKRDWNCLNFIAGSFQEIQEIIKSKHSNVVIGRSKAEVEKKLAEIVPERSKWKEFSTSNIVGTARECVESLRKYILVGVEYFTLNFPDLFEIDPLKLFMTDVVGALKEMEISASGEQM